MKTIFDFRPTNAELIALFGFDKERMAYGFCVFKLPLEDYDIENSLEGKLLDLALLFELRRLHEEAGKVWKQIPKLRHQYSRNKKGVKVID